LKDYQKQPLADDLEVEKTSDALKDVTIGLCVGGGIAAIEAPRVIRELRRYGAKVSVYTTENALRFIGKDALEWASGKPVITASSGLAEHIAQDDVALVFPATADIIGKAAHGICPDSCTTYLQSSLGARKLVLFLPTMHDSLRLSPAFQNNVEILSSFDNVEFLEPRIEEGKWKSPSPEEIGLETAYRYNRHRQGNSRSKVLVTLGGTTTELDSARVISNSSSGTLGSQLIKQLLERGISVKALCGNHSAKLPKCTGVEYVHAPRFDDFRQWLSQEKNIKQLSGFFHLAAVSDYALAGEKNGKIDSSQPTLNIKLMQLPKLIKLPTVNKIPFKIGCKFTDSNSKTSMEKASRLLIDCRLDMVFWNWGQGAFGNEDQTSGLLISHNPKENISIVSKRQISKLLVEAYLKGKKA
jgi:phosphopantothenoylcysteine decarboxylase/phosphopantothenate--cysteine ligase